MSEVTKRLVIAILVALSCAAAYLVTKKDSSPTSLDNGQPIILKSQPDEVEEDGDEHIVGAWGEVVIKKNHSDSAR